MRLSRPAAYAVALALVGLPACQPGAPVQPAASGAPASPPATKALGVVFGQLRLPTAVVASQGGSIVAQGGGNFISANGAGIVAQGGGNIVAQGGGNLVAAGTGQIISMNGAGVVAQGGGNIVAQGGGNLSNAYAGIVASGGANIVAQGGGNLVGNSGGTYRVAGANDVIDALAIRPSSLVDPQVAPGDSHPIAHAVVFLTDADGKPLPGAPYAVTDDQGYYFFAGLPTTKPVIATTPFLPTGIRGNIVAQGGGNFISANGAGTVAQGGGNLVGNSGGTYGLLDATNPVLEQDVVKASPKVLAMPTTLDHLPADAGAGVAAIAGRNGLALAAPGGYHALDEHTHNGDISLATTITSNLLLAGQQGQVVELDQAQFDVVVDRVADALLTAPLSTVFQPLPEVPLLVDLQKLDLPAGTDLTFRQRDQELVANEQARKQAEADLAKLDGDAKKAKAAELAQLEADAKRVAREKVQALFDLAAKLQQKLAITVKTDSKPVDADGDGALDAPPDSRGLPPTGGAGDPTPAPASNPTSAPEPVATQEPDGLPTDDPEPTPSPSVDVDGSITVTPGGVTNAGTEQIP